MKKSIQAILNNNINSRLVIIISCILLWSTLSSQVIYTDINDTILTFPEQITGILDDSTNYFYFDLDRDGVDDFYFYAHYWEEWMSPSAPEYPFRVMQLEAIEGSGVPWSDGCAVDYGLDDAIQSEEWFEYGLLFLDVFGASTNCNLPFQDRYIGLRLEEGTDYFYGWIRLDASRDTLIFKDFAYNSEANAIILAGQTGPAGFSEMNNTEELFCIFPNPAIATVTLEYQMLNKAWVKVSLLDLSGHTVKNLFSGYKNQGMQQFVLDCNDLEAGIYLIRLQSDKEILTKKLVVQ